MSTVIRFPRSHPPQPMPYALPPDVPTSVRADRLSVALAQGGHLSWAAEASQIAGEIRRKERALDEAVAESREQAVIAERLARGECV